VLGLKNNVSLVEIKNTYKKLVLIYHPDKNVNDKEQMRKEKEQKFRDIQEAYEYLINNYKEPKPRKKPEKKKPNIDKKPRTTKPKSNIKKTDNNNLKKNQESDLLKSLLREVISEMLK
jgi:curved DNA-binding protein CbpA